MVEQWQDESPETQIADHIQYLATRAAQWGADQELEACCAELPGLDDYLRAARRPKLWSLKEQALQLLETYNTSGVMLTADQVDTIRRALEALDD
jgi:hypothetical protein